MKKNKNGFYIVEILIGIFIFTLGLISIYILIVSTMKMNDYSKNSIIASNLAREGIEIVRNTRDSNYKKIYKWNKLPGNDFYNLFQTGVYYKIENGITLYSSNPIIFEEISDFGEGEDEVNSKMQNYKLCLTPNNVYTYDCSTTGNKESYFYRYIKFDDAKYDDSGTVKTISGALKLTSKVIWYNRGYHEVKIDTVITDFLRQ